MDSRTGSQADPDRSLIEAALRDAAELRPAPNSPGRQTYESEIPIFPGGIPGYEVIREIHRGGQGIVYQGVQKSTRRKVAIKVMKEGPFAGARDRARFEREMHILAQLSDPHIVGIHDSGSVAGCFFYVMDYVSGPTLDLYIASRRWTVREVLQIFARICDAIAAAHILGITHRDIKPANIRIDTRGEPRVLDFGLAKVASSDALGDADPKLLSMTGEFIGSLPWASPEQAEGISGHIDTRTDVYSLGVTIYQMLTGAFPYSVVGSMRDVLDNILHAEPVKPRSIRKEIDDEVETIVLKCLAKERERRYQSAGELARDVVHYLAGEPIEAKRDSGWYLLRKAMARHKGLVAAVAVVFVLTVGFAITMSILYRQSEFLLARANSAERAATRIQQFLQSTLAGADPEESAPNMTIREVLDRAADRVAAELQDQPEVEAAIHQTIGEIYQNRNFYDQAQRHLQRAVDLRRQVFGEQSTELADSLHRLAAVYWKKDDLRSAEPLYRRALDIRIRVHGPGHLSVADSQNHLAACLQRQGNYPEAQQLFVAALQLRRGIPGTSRREIARSLNNLAGFYRDCGDFARAEPLYKEALDEFRSIHGQEHIDVARVMGSLGACYLDEGRCDDARRFLMLSLEMKERVSEPRDLSLANTQHHLSRLMTICNPPELQAAEKQCREALALRQERQPEAHRDIGESLALLALIRYRLGFANEAAEIFTRADAIMRRSLPSNHWQFAECAQKRGACLVSLGKLEEAERVLLEGLEVARRMTGARTVLHRELKNEIIHLYEQWGKPEKLPMYRAEPGKINDE